MVPTLNPRLRHTNGHIAGFPLASGFMVQPSPLAFVTRTDTPLDFHSPSPAPPHNWMCLKFLRAANCYQAATFSPEAPEKGKRAGCR